MAVQWSVAVRNARLNAFASAIGGSPTISLYAGAEPASCADALSTEVNPLLATFDLAEVWMEEAVNGEVSLAGLPLQTAATGGGQGTDATFYRLYDSAGNCHEQGLVTEENEGGDMIIDNASIVTGQTVQITAYTKTELGE